MSAGSRIARLAALAIGVALLAPLPTLAQDAQASAPAVTIGLDSLQQSGTACRVTLVVGNGLGADLSRVAYEFVFFDSDGRVELLTVLDLRDVPSGRTRVRQFDLPGLECAAISRLLVNDAKACEGPGIAEAACLERLSTTSKAEIPLES